MSSSIRLSPPGLIRDGVFERADAGPGFDTAFNWEGYEHGAGFHKSGRGRVQYKISAML